MTYGVGNSISWLGQAEKCCGINRSMGSSDDFSAKKNTVLNVSLWPQLLQYEACDMDKKIIEMLLIYEVRFFLIWKYISIYIHILQVTAVKVDIAIVINKQTPFVEV